MTDPDIPIPALNMLRSTLSRGNAEASQKRPVAVRVTAQSVLNRPTFKTAAALSAAKAMQHQAAAGPSEYDALRASEQTSNLAATLKP